VGGKVKEAVAEVWHGIKEATPGTKVGQLGGVEKVGRVAGAAPLLLQRASRHSGCMTCPRAPRIQEHKQEFGADVALGGYRSQMGKR
jgi:hypothetical protein